MTNIEKNLAWAWYRSLSIFQQMEMERKYLGDSFKYNYSLVLAYVPEMWMREHPIVTVPPKVG